VNVSPSSPPSDDGPITLKVFSFGGGTSGFDGTFSVNQATGEVSVSNAGPGGSYTITVSVEDDCSTVTRTLVLNVLKYEAPPTLVSSANPSVPGDKVTFAASIEAPRGAPAPTGSVVFRIDGIARGLPVLLTRGGVAATTLPLGPGSHQITAIYLGDENYNRSEATITQVVSRTLGR